MEKESSPSCPNTVAVRRNPPRRARATPSSAGPLSLYPSSKISSAIRSFPIQDILSIDVPEVENPKLEVSESLSPKRPPVSENLKVFLRIRPIVMQQKAGGSVKNGAQKNVWPQNPNRKRDALKTAKDAGKKKSEICLKVNDSHSVTLCPPQSLQDVRRTKTEVYEGFSHVFCAESSQSEVYKRMVNPLVEDFLKGKSGMLAAMGPSGSGKTHTVFGSSREPGMVSLALRRIFSAKESNGSNCSRTFYLSMFEIYSERGKGEKVMDLSQGGGDLCMQQSNIKGLQEVVIHDAPQAESLIASGMLKRSTAMTNSNIQSSRSQCIINIRSGLDNIDEDAIAQSCTALLTIVDLAGAEREKRTGNQGARLLESNFINNTSMVFGLCLRSLLDHQRNPKKPFHKHFQNSLLTKYLRDFLEGKKRMTLVLTAKSGEEDYHDTSYLLRQASPFRNIKFENVEEQPANAFGIKRRIQTFSKTEQLKRMKFSSNEVCMDGHGKNGILQQLHKEELIPEQVREMETNGSFIECPNISNIEVNENRSVKANITGRVKKARENKILLSFSRALWNVLKEYKNKLETSENAVDSLRHSLTVEKERCSSLEAELNLMKASCSCGKKAVAEGPQLEEYGSKFKSTNCSFELEGDQSIDVHEVHAQVSTSNLCEVESVDNKLGDTNGATCVEVTSTSVGLENFGEQSNEDDVSCAYVVFAKEDLKELEDREYRKEIAGCDTLASVVSSLESLVHGDEVSSFVEGDQWQYEEQKGMGSVEVIETSVDLEKFEEQPNEKANVSSANVVFDKEDFNELEEREASGELAGCDTLDSTVSGSVSLVVHGDELSSSVEGDRSQQEEEGTNSVEVISTTVGLEDLEEQCNQITDGSIANVEFGKEDFKEFEEREAGREIAGCDTLDSATGGSELPLSFGDEVSSCLEEGKSQQEDKELNVQITSNQEGLKCMESRQFSDLTDIPEGCNAGKLLEAEASLAQPCQSFNAIKPKRRLQPASTVLLRNINSLHSDDATDIPKHGKRGEKKVSADVNTQRTQGSISLLRLLKENLGH